MCSCNLRDRIELAARNQGLGNQRLSFGFGAVAVFFEVLRAPCF